MGSKSIIIMGDETTNLLTDRLEVLDEPPKSDVLG